MRSQLSERPARERASVLPLVWFGALRDPSGYADEARAFLLALDRAGCGVTARELRWTDMDAGVSGNQLATLERALSRPIPSEEYALVYHGVPYAGQPLHDMGPSIARTMFETDRAPGSWLRMLIEVDEIWIPSEFNRETFERSGLPGSRMHVLPGTLDFDCFDPAVVEPLPIEGKRGFTFLTSFDFTDRKGWDLLLDAWADAFVPDDDVCLVLKCLAMHSSEAIVRARVAERLRGRSVAPIVLDTRVLPASTLPGLYAAADAFVLASRGEGWGRPYMEAMAMGLPTIGSRFGGNLAFMNDGNSWLVDGELVPVPESAQRHTPLYQGHRWFDPDRDSLIENMRAVAAAGDETRATAAVVRGELLERFGSEAVVERLRELAAGALERWRWRQTRPVACAWRGDWGSCHSLATVNDGVVDALEASGEVVSRMMPETPPLATDAIGVAHHWPPSFEPPTAGPFVLYQPWEFGAIPGVWADEIRRSVDEVWTLSEASRAAFIASGIAPELVHIVPAGVDLAHFAPDGPARSLPRRAGTVFLFVGGLIHRKGVDLLLRAYGRAFGASDDVLLVLKGFGAQSFYQGMTIGATVARFAAQSGAPAVALVDDDIPYAEMPAFYRAADVLVQPYRAEGFCLPALEALACGRPVIVTAGGPTDEFVSDACAWRIPSRRMPLPAGALPPALAPAGEGFMLEPDVEALVMMLREAADPAARALRAPCARPQAEAFSWERAAAAAAARIADLKEKTPIRYLAAAAVPGRRRVLFAVFVDWARSETWAPPLIAYARAFGADADTTLALAAQALGDGALVEAELRAAGIDPAAIADVVLVDGLADPAPLELAADAVVVTNGHRPARARRILPPEPQALRQLAGAG